MNRTFKEVPTFTSKWQSLGLTDDDLRILENILLKNPKIGDAITGTGGLSVCQKRKDGFDTKRETNSQKTGNCLKGGITMGFYEDMQQSLLEAIEMDNGNIPLTEKDNMPAITLIANVDEPNKE